MINKINKKSLPAGRQGFTLMETLVAVLMLSLAIVGPLSIAQKGLRIALVSKDQITAFYLAQDAIEYIRYARDTNCLAAGSLPGGCPAGQWLLGTGATPTNLTNCVSSDGTGACTIDVIAFTQPAPCIGGICSAMNYDTSNNYYTYVSGSASIFTRTVSITSPVCGGGGAPCNANEALLTVKVSWSDPAPHSVTVKENLFDWQ